MIQTKETSGKSYYFSAAYQFLIKTAW